MRISEPGLHLLGGGAVAELEEKFRRLYGVRHALCVSSGTTGLLVVGLALGLRQSQFITSPFTYGASLAAWLLLGNRPRFADIEPETLTLDPDSVRRRISRRDRAILGVDIFGVPSDTIALRKIADKHGIFYVADASQSFGAWRDGLLASSLADAWVISLTTGKPLSVGEGGMILTNNTVLYEKCVWCSQHPDRQRRELGLSLVNEFAVNGRIHPLAAALANETFEMALQRLEEKQQICFRIIEALNGMGLTEPIHFARRHIVPSFFRLTAAWRNRQNEECLRTQLSRQGLQVRLTPAPVRLIYRQPAFLAQYKAERSSCPIAERQERQRFCLVPGDGNKDSLHVPEARLSAAARAITGK